MAEQEENLLDETEATETEETVEKVIPEIDSKYRKIILAAQRAKQLQRGAQPRIDEDPRKLKNTRIALKELDQKKIYFDILDQ